MVANWVCRLNESESRLHKERVLCEALSLSMLGEINAKLFLSLVKFTYDPYVTFGVKQVPIAQVSSDDEHKENPWVEFIELLNLLETRKLTGNNARNEILNISNRFHSFEWNNVCAPVIRKDLRAGISDKTINKIVKNTEYEIPVFTCQLATNCENRPEMAGNKRLEPKLDGVRVLMFVAAADDGSISVTSFSRNGKIFENFTHIESQIAENYDKLLTCTNFSLNQSSFVLDGEVIGNSFQELMRQARRKENVQATDSVFNIFDIIPLSDFRNGYWNAQLSKRVAIIKKMSKVVDLMPNVELLPHIDVNLSCEEGNKAFNDYCNEMVNAGFEGVMIKSLDAPYECKRNTFWMKYKPTITVDLEVLDVEEGTGRNRGRLGALVCHGIDHGKNITVNVGSGFSDIDRDEFWINRDMVIGRTVEILCDIITQNRDGTYSLRFPRFVRFRDDK